MGLDLDEEPGIPRHALRRGADRAGDREHDAARRRSAPIRTTAIPSRASTPIVGEARELFDQLAAAGVDYDDVTDTLEREGVEKFAAVVRRGAVEHASQRAKLPV